MTIGQRRDQEIEETVGPGTYSPSHKLTKLSAQQPDFINRTGRDNYDGSPEHGPGTYNHSKEFGSDLKPMTIGRRYEEQLPDGPAPGQYKPERADHQTKQKPMEVDFKSKTGRG